LRRSAQIHSPESERPALVTEQELTRHLNLSRTTLWRMRAAGLPHVMVGRHVRYDLSSVRSWLESGAAERADLFGQGPASILRSHVREDVRVVLPSCHWSRAVALDPKHRPQLPNRPATTVRREWWRFPQEAHLLDLHQWRYRRLRAREIAVLQGFEPSWGTDTGVSDLDLIRGYGDAVPPSMAEAIFGALQEHLRVPLRSSLEICAGFGGMALGKHRALTLARHVLVDSWPQACAILRAAGIWEPDSVLQEDLDTFDWQRAAGEIDLLSGGPPCQPWSRAGKGLGATDGRDLLGDTPTMVARLEPKAFVFENVPGLLTGENAPYAETLIDRLRQPGPTLQYGVAAGILNAADFGVPQVRRRVFVIGVRGAPVQEIHRVFDVIARRRRFADPSRVIPERSVPWRTLADALPDWAHVDDGWRRWVSQDAEDANLLEQLLHSAAERQQ